MLLIITCKRNLTVLSFLFFDCKKKLRALFSSFSFAYRRRKKHSCRFFSKAFLDGKKADGGIRKSRLFFLLFSLCRDSSVQRINEKVFLSFFIFLPSNASSSRDNPPLVDVVPLLVGVFRELVGFAPVPPFRSSN